MFVLSPVSLESNFIILTRQHNETAINRGRNIKLFRLVTRKWIMFLVILDMVLHFFHLLPEIMVDFKYGRIVDTQEIKKLSGMQLDNTLSEGAFPCKHQQTFPSNLALEVSQLLQKLSGPFQGKVNQNHTNVSITLPLKIFNRAHTSFRVLSLQSFSCESFHHPLFSIYLRRRVIG